MHTIHINLTIIRETVLLERKTRFETRNSSRSRLCFVVFFFFLINNINNCCAEVYNPDVDRKLLPHTITTIARPLEAKIFNQCCFM